MTDTTIDVLVRRARMADAIAKPHARFGTTIASLAAGAGAELVARQQLAREILQMRIERRRKKA